MARSTDCEDHKHQCALKFIMDEADLNADDNLADLTDEMWSAMLIEAVEGGDEFFDYDGSMTSVAHNSMAF